MKMLCHYHHGDSAMLVKSQSRKNNPYKSRNLHHLVYGCSLMSDFLKQWSDNSRSVLIYGKGGRILKKYPRHNCAKEIIFLRGFNHRNTLL